MLRMLIEKSKAVLPEASAFFELLGFAILASGIFSGLALITYDPTDSTKLFATFATGETYQNMVGPAGAWLADFLLGTFGLVSFFIASILFFWGGTMALGFVRWPKTKRFVGFALIVVVFCGLIHIDEPNPRDTHLSNGFGGAIGTTLGNTLLDSVGYGGAVIGLIFAAVAGLVVTGNLTVSNTARFVEYLLFLLQRFISEPTGKRVRRHIASLRTPQTDGEDGTRAAQPMTGGEDEESEIGIEVDLTSAVPKHAKPAIDIFHTSKANSSDKTDFRALVKQLESQLHEFKVEGKITNITVGPVVTTLEYEPTAGTKAAQIVSIANDIARMLRAHSVRVIPALPGKNTVGIEIPSAQRRVIRLGDVLKSAKYRSSEVILPVALDQRIRVRLDFLRVRGLGDA